MIGAVILAAGAAKRFGGRKQFLPYEGKTLLENAIEAVSGAMDGPIVITTGNEHERIQDLATKYISRHNLQIVQCANWSRGMGTSLAWGVRDLCKSFPELNAILVSVCDQPHLNSKTIAELLRLQAEHPTETVATTYKGTIGPPACFARADFASLQQLKGERGAKALLTDPTKPIRTLAFPLGAIDIDTPTDYDLLINSTETH